MDFSKDSEGTFSQQGNQWNSPRGGGRGGARGGGFGNFSHSQNYNQNQNYNQSSYQSSQPQQWAPPAGAPSQNQPPPSWAPAPPQQQQPPPQQAPAPSGPPKIFVRADGCDAFLDLRVILPSDRFPNINWGGRVIGSKGATIKMLQNEHNVKILIKDCS